MSKRPKSSIQQTENHGFAGDEASHPAQAWERPSRRKFLQAAGAAGAVMALDAGVKGAIRATEVRTIFFNFSHENYSAATYYWVTPMGRFELAPVTAGHPALVQARQKNNFLRAIPDSQITHVLHNVATPTNRVYLSYAMSIPDKNSPEWLMSGVYYNVPTGPTTATYQQLAQSLVAGQSLPLSAKRQKYGLAPAASAQDLLDEQALLDSTDHAAAMVMGHPEIANADANAANYTYTGIQQNRQLFDLSTQLERLGPAAPQATSSQSNESGWATLEPVTDNGGTPLKFTKGNNKGLNAYSPAFNSTLAPHLLPVTASSLVNVKNDEKNTAADVTNSPDPSTLAGRVWFRRDATTSVNQNPGLTATNSAIDPVSNNEQAGLSCYGIITNSGSVTTLSLTVKNWWVRWLGVYIQYLNAAGNPIPLSQIPPASHPHPNGDTGDLAYLGIITPELTILGVPFQASQLAPSFPFPTDVASRANIICGGLGQGAHPYRDAELSGDIMTSIFNLAIPGLLLALGIANIGSIPLLVKTVAIPVAQILTTELLAGLGADATPGQLLTILERSLMGVAQNGAFWGALLTAFGKFLVSQEVESAVTDEIPIAGLCLKLVGFAVAAANIVETVAEIASAPNTYIFPMTLTRDLSVTINHDPNNDKFPTEARSYTVTAIFDQGKPYTQTLSMAGGEASLKPVTFTGVPLGGKAVVSVGFYDANQNVVGNGTSNTFINDANAKPTITIAQSLIVIGAGTQYVHTKKTVLDPDGNRTWKSGSAPATPSPNCEDNPGDLCQLSKITIRQGTSTVAGEIGYAWKSYSSGVSACGSGGKAQLDQIVNIGDTDAQGSYAALPCGLPTGAKVTYNLLSHPAPNQPPNFSNHNFYLESGSNLIRQVQLDPPSFANPAEGMAWGKFNADPTDILLHPSGRIVSVNNANHILETVNLPDAPQSDADAAVNLIAQVYSGQGTKPGRLGGPVAAVMTSLGTVLVLESDNNRIQALDVFGNPVQLFKNQTSPYFLNLDETNGSIYLDIAVEYSGFIYVLSSDQGQTMYRLDIYHPSQTGTAPISKTMSFNAGRIVVDYWRNVYALNYEVLALPNGHLPQTGITEPSVSLWIPENSSSDAALSPPAPWSAPSPSAFRAPRPLRRRQLLSSLISPWRIA